mmetsp:Transcript_43231/g.71901  ORF Transcript_43231/g.71901 Transcript_43231/m.71901 type:complete len:256 (-) Transcript_43231:467-1234(-)|eukprot:CAMPEP_0119330302 /NCGR_PEP_ID=MMETSP1333-20130426/77987_1 /TAXON_ID=418940 /ORGANISM="Scyphosphaera apsteinii, Strain RCC1455" /LENGTH=255 /DNA_ID=CAMNT_0007339673 /DNA_START=66 /DNA_END=833 /DNA_ORIENTATION=-
MSAAVVSLIDDDDDSIIASCKSSAPGCSATMPLVLDDSPSANGRASMPPARKVPHTAPVPEVLHTAPVREVPYTAPVQEQAPAHGLKRERFSQPAEAGDIAYANLWYYIDNNGEQQGPFESANMRTWLEAGYLLWSTKVAPTYYGEVPSKFWPVLELWEYPQVQAFVLASDAVIVVPEASSGPEFIEAEDFQGYKEGYVYRNDTYGVGYYKDEPPIPVITFESIQRERMEEKYRRIQSQKLKANTTFGPKFDGVR